MQFISITLFLVRLSASASFLFREETVGCIWVVGFTSFSFSEIVGVVNFTSFSEIVGIVVFTSLSRSSFLMLISMKSISDWTRPKKSHPADHPGGVKNYSILIYFIIRQIKT